MEFILIELMERFPVLTTVYMGLSGAYITFCAVASFTKNKYDDDLADKLKRFFSLPVKK